MNPDKMIVMGKLATENTSWVAGELPEYAGRRLHCIRYLLTVCRWGRAIYTVNDKRAPLHTTMNKGREANAYLTFIVEHYHDLPSILAFIHPHKEGYLNAWHTDNDMYSNVVSLKNLQLDFVQRQGYANLRCNIDPGCPDDLAPGPTRKIAEPLIPDFWPHLFGNVRMPEEISQPCCSQFAVSKSQILKRPLDDYRRYLRWILEGEVDEDKAGRVMEYLWQIIFGQASKFCFDMEQCYCNVYGWCFPD